jgi:hypothetical protein
MLMADLLSASVLATKSLHAGNPTGQAPKARLPQKWSLEKTARVSDKRLCHGNNLHSCHIMDSLILTLTNRNLEYRGLPASCHFMLQGVF